jgi:hypothetical protein
MNNPPGAQLWSFVVNPGPLGFLYTIRLNTTLEEIATLLIGK